MTFSLMANSAVNMQTSFPPLPPRIPGRFGGGFCNGPAMPPASQPAPIPMPAPVPPFGGGGYQTSSYNNFSQQSYIDASNYFQSMSSQNYYSLNSPMGSMSSYQSFNSMFSNQASQGSYGGGNFSYSDFQRSTSMSSYQCPPMPPAPPSQSAWSDTGVSDNKGSIDLGQFKLDLDKSNSSMLLTDKANNISTKLWGDPHIDFNAGSGGQTSGMFNGSMTFDLPDNTTIGVHTQPGNGGVSYTDGLTITRGNQAYNVTGLSEKNPAGLSVQRSNGYAELQNQPQDGPRLMATGSGTGWVNEQTHQMAKASDFSA